MQQHQQQQQQQQLLIKQMKEAEQLKQNPSEVDESSLVEDESLNTSQVTTNSTTDNNKSVDKSTNLSRFRDEYDGTTDKSSMLNSNFDKSYMDKEYEKSAAPSNFEQSYIKSIEDQSILMKKSFDDNSFINTNMEESEFPGEASRYAKSYEASAIDDKSMMLRSQIEEKSFVDSPIDPIKKSLKPSSKNKKETSKVKKNPVKKTNIIKEKKEIKKLPPVNKSDIISSIPKDHIKTPSISKSPSDNDIMEDDKSIMMQSKFEDQSYIESVLIDKKSVSPTVFDDKDDTSLVSGVSSKFKTKLDIGSYKSLSPTSNTPDNISYDNKSMVSTRSMMLKSNIQEDSFQNSMLSENLSTFSVSPTLFGEDQSILSDNSMLLGGNIEEKSYLNSTMSDSKSLLSNVLKDDMDDSFNQSIVSSASDKSIKSNKSKTSKSTKSLKQNASDSSQNTISDTKEIKNAKEDIVDKNSIKDKKLSKKKIMDQKLKILNEDIEKRRKDVKKNTLNKIKNIASDSSLSVELEKNDLSKLKKMENEIP